MQAHAGRCGPTAAGPRGSGPTPPARRCHSRPAQGKAPPALSLRSSDVVWETAATPSGPFCAWPRTHAAPASLTRTPPAVAEASRRSLAAGVAHAWASFKDQVWPAEDKRLPPEVEALSGTYTDGLPGCVVNREDDTGLLALWRYQGFKL